MMRVNVLRALAETKRVYLLFKALKAFGLAGYPKFLNSGENHWGER